MTANKGGCFLAWIHMVPPWEFPSAIIALMTRNPHYLLSNWRGMPSLFTNLPVNPPLKSFTRGASKLGRPRRALFRSLTASLLFKAECKGR